jgi:ribonuclease HI
MLYVKACFDCAFFASPFPYKMIVDTEEIRAAYERCASPKAGFCRVLLPLRIAADYAFSVTQGTVPGRAPLSLAEHEGPAATLLALQGHLQVPASLTTAAEARIWRPITAPFLDGLRIWHDADGQPREPNRDPNREIIVATDGGCIGNGKADSSGAWAYLIDNYVAKAEAVPAVLLDGECRRTEIPCPPTNNRAELIAILMAVRFLCGLQLKNDVCIITDSEYSINVLTKWLASWEARGEIGVKANPDLSVLLSEAIARYGRDRIRYVHVRSHQKAAGVDPGTLPSSAASLLPEHVRFLNERVDAMATRVMREHPHPQDPCSADTLRTAPPRAQRKP